MKKSAILLVFAGLAALSHADLYGIGSNGFDPLLPAGLYKVDSSTGNAAFQTDIAGPSNDFINLSIVGAAYLNGRIYVTDTFNSDSGNMFGYIDPATGIYTGVSGQGSSVNWWTLAADPSANALYTIEAEGGNHPDTTDYGSVYRIDPATGGTTNLGKATLNGSLQFVDTLAFDSKNSTMYAFAGGSLYTLDLATTQLTLVGNSGGPGVDNGWDTTYDPTTDTLYANDGGSHLLYSVDRTSGAFTLVGDNNTLAHIDGLAGGTPVPEPASFAALALGVAALRRRRAKR